MTISIWFMIFSPFPRTAWSARFPSTRPWISAPRKESTRARKSLRRASLSITRSSKRRSNSLENNSRQQSIIIKLERHEHDIYSQHFDGIGFGGGCRRRAGRGADFKENSHRLSIPQLSPVQRLGGQ